MLLWAGSLAGARAQMHLQEALGKVDVTDGLARAGHQYPADAAYRSEAHPSGPGNRDEYIAQARTRADVPMCNQRHA